MARSSILVRDGRHTRPMLVVLERYGIGNVDKYGRGRWINKSMLPKILDCMKADKSYRHIMWKDRHGNIEFEDHCVIIGTCINNYVSYDEFIELFNK